jgi:hypothetical protein
MTRVLLVGYDPETVDFSNPALPTGMTAGKIRAGVALTLKQMKTEDGRAMSVTFVRTERLGRRWNVTWLPQTVLVL